MFDLKSLDQLGPITEEMLGGLHADEAMRLKIKRAAAEGKTAVRRPAARFVPAVCCAALALCCVGVWSTTRHVTDKPGMVSEPAMISEPVMVSTIAAGDGAAFDGATLVADLNDNVMMRKAAGNADSLFAEGGGDAPLVAIGNGVYRMLKTPKDIGNSLLGESLGDVRLFDEQPSLASPKEMSAGLSNIAPQGTVVYSLRGLPGTTAVAAEVDGGMRVFQRVSYAGRGPAGDSLEETFSVRGKVKEAELSGVGTIKGEKANEVMAELLDQAVLKSADMASGRQTLTVTLDNGLKLQLGVSGDTVCGCGGWSCPEFFEAFEAAL